jgi:hypothetical protein
MEHSNVQAHKMDSLFTLEPVAQAPTHGEDYSSHAVLGSVIQSIDFRIQLMNSLVRLLAIGMADVFESKGMTETRLSYLLAILNYAEATGNMLTTSFPFPNDVQPGDPHLETHIIQTKAALATFTEKFADIAQVLASCEAPFEFPVAYFELADQLSVGWRARTSPLQGELDQSSVEEFLATMHEHVQRNDVSILYIVLKHYEIAMLQAYSEPLRGYSVAAELLTLWNSKLKALVETFDLNVMSCPSDIDAANHKMLQYLETLASGAPVPDMQPLWPNFFRTIEQGLFNAALVNAVSDAKLRRRLEHLSVARYCALEKASLAPVTELLAARGLDEEALVDTAEIAARLKHTARAIREQFKPGSIEYVVGTNFDTYEILFRLFRREHHDEKDDTVVEIVVDTQEDSTSQQLHEFVHALIKLKAQLIFSVLVVGTASVTLFRDEPIGSSK